MPTFEEMAAAYIEAVMPPSTTMVCPVMSSEPVMKLIARSGLDFHKEVSDGVGYVRGFLHEEHKFADYLAR